MARQYATRIVLNWNLLTNRLKGCQLLANSLRLQESDLIGDDGGKGVFILLWRDGSLLLPGNFFTVVKADSFLVSTAL